jgi:UDP-glucose 4-epimerase
MTLLVTGGTGFVMSNVAKRWLEDDPTASCVVLDAAPPDAAAQRFFASVADRLSFLGGDVRDAAVWTSLTGAFEITHVVHGATLTSAREDDGAQARMILEVNLMGTVAALEAARRLPRLRRFIYVSSGAVYGEYEGGEPSDPTPETGGVDTDSLYAITKFAAEGVTTRYGQKFGLDVASVRLSTVYGPMDRRTPARESESVPYKLAHLALAREPIAVNSLDGGGDWIHAEDVAVAIGALLRATALKHRIYNIAQGEFVRTGELLAIIGEVVAGLRYGVVTSELANVVWDPRQRRGAYGAYDISRLGQDVGWRPRPIRDALQSYLAWLGENEIDRAPAGHV